MNTWNCQDKPIPPGTQVLFIGQDGRVAQGLVARSQTIRIKGMKSLGKQYRAQVVHQGRLIAPPMLVQTTDQIGCREIYRESYLLLEGVAQ